MGVFIRNKKKKFSNTNTQLYIKNNDNGHIVGEERDIPNKHSINKQTLNKTSQQLSLKGKSKKELREQVKPQKNEDVIGVEKNDKKKNTVVTKEPNVSYENRNVINKILDDNNVNLSFIDLTSFKSFIKNKEIAIVANSSDLLRCENGKKIDSYDIVVRFNSFKIDPVYTGTKTTIHSSIHLQDINLDYFVSIRLIMCNNLTKWAKKLNTLNKFNQTFILKYNHPTTLDLHYGAQLTTGLNTLITLLKLGGYKKIDLFGFTFYDGWDKSILRTDVGLTHPISKVHDYGFEKSFIFEKMDDYDKENNIITFYDNCSL